MKKEIMKFTAIVFFAVLATSCIKKNETKTESQTKTDVIEKDENSAKSKKTKDFANRIYEILEGDYYNSITFVDSDFCAMGLGVVYYTYDKKNKTVTINFTFPNDKTTLQYDPENDSLTSEEGFVFKYTRECTADELENAKEWKEAIEQMNN